MTIKPYITLEYLSSLKKLKAPLPISRYIKKNGLDFYNLAAKSPLREFSHPEHFISNYFKVFKLNSMYTVEEYNNPFYDIDKKYLEAVNQFIGRINQMLHQAKEEQLNGIFFYELFEWLEHDSNATQWLINMNQTLKYLTYDNYDIEHEVGLLINTFILTYILNELDEFNPL